MTRTRTAIAYVAVLISSGVVFSSASLCQQPRQQPADAESMGTIRLGDSLKEARRVVEIAKFPPGGLRAYASHPDGDRWLFYAVRENEVDLVVQYSPQMQQVTGLTLYYLGYPRSKTSDVGVTAKSIEFFSDGSYTAAYPPAP